PTNAEQLLAGCAASVIVTEPPSNADGGTPAANRVTWIGTDRPTTSGAELSAIMVGPGGTVVVVDPTDGLVAASPRDLATTVCLPAVPRVVEHVAVGPSGPAVTGTAVQRSVPPTEKVTVPVGVARLLS